MREVALVVVVVGCASGGRDVVVDASATGDTSAQLDGPSALVDAPGTKTLSQTTSSQLEPLSSIACAANPPGTNANNYYRVFDLPALGITSDFQVSSVSFQVEHCDQINGNAGAIVAVRVGTYAGTPGATLDLAAMTILASNPTVNVPEVIETSSPASTPGGTVTAPIDATIPAGQKLLVEIDAPDGHNQYYLYLGANNDGETAFGYALAPACTITVPTNISSINSAHPAVHLLISVTGQY